MTGKRSLLMDSTLRPSDKSHITFADTGKSKVLGLGRVAISKDQHMDKVMLVESLGFNLMSVSMLCDLNMIVMFGKYRCLVLMESDKSLVFEGHQNDDLYVVDLSAGPQLDICLLAKASECWLWHRRLGACWHEEPTHTRQEEACHRHRGCQVQEASFVWCLRSWKDD